VTEIQEIATRDFMTQLFTDCDEIKSELKPTTSIQVGDQKFYFSPVLVGSNRHEVVIMYTVKNGFILPRLLYKSQSGGNWRGTSGYIDYYDDGSLIFDKGQQYTQGTRLNSKIADHLEGQMELMGQKDLNLKCLETFFYVPNQLRYKNADKLYTFRTEVAVEAHSGQSKDNPLLQVLHECPPGWCFSSSVKHGHQTFSNYKEYIEQVVNPTLENTSFMPAFNKKNCEQSYYMGHPLLSDHKNGKLEKDILIRICMGTLNGKQVEWHMATDRVGRVWIDSIRYKDNPVSTYGTDTQVIDSGILVNKPLEYAHACTKLQDGTDKYLFDETYDDITPLLVNLLPIQKFKEAFPFFSSSTSTTTTHSPEISVNRAGPDGWSPFLRTAQKGNAEHIARLLKIPGIDVNQATTKESWTALCLAAKNGNGSVVKALLAHKGPPPIDLNQACPDQWTALNFASHFGHLEIVEWLVEAGASKEKPNREGFTPLAQAVSSDRLEVVQYLLKRGANPNAKGHNGMSVEFVSENPTNGIPNLKMVELIAGAIARSSSTSPPSNSSSSSSSSSSSAAPATKTTPINLETDTTTVQAILSRIALWMKTKSVTTTTQVAPQGIASGAPK